MELTKKAAEELKKLKTKLIEESEYLEAMQLQMQQASNHKIYQIYQRERNCASNKRYKIEEQVKEIEAMGISSGEVKALMREASVSVNSKFVTIQRSKSLGCTDYVKVGWSKVLTAFIKISYMQYNGFMRNVRGCASLANKKHFGSFARLTESETDELLKAGRKVEVNFLGHDDKITPISQTAASLKEYVYDETTGG